MWKNINVSSAGFNEVQFFCISPYGSRSGTPFVNDLPPTAGETLPDVCFNISLA